VGVVTPLKLVVIEPGSIEPVPEVIDAAAATDVAALKQLTELWWLEGTTELSGFTDQGKLLVPRGLGTLEAQLLYGYGEYKESVSVKGCISPLN
jgi:hypothetical protein